MATAAAGEPVQVTFQDLQTMRQKIEQEMSVLTDAITTLQTIQQHFLNSQDVSRQLEEVKSGDEMFVPLCDGLLVRGKAVQPEKTLVDIGAGYFVEMTQPKCREYCKRRLDFLNAQILSLQRAGQEKYTQRQQIVDILQRQLAQMKLNQSAQKP